MTESERQAVFNDPKMPNSVKKLLMSSEYGVIGRRLDPTTQKEHRELAAEISDVVQGVLR